jgi:hypothetical protein
VAWGDAKSSLECPPESVRRFESERTGDRFHRFTRTHEPGFCFIQAEFTDERRRGRAKGAPELAAEMAGREMNPASKLLDSERLLQMTLHPGDQVGKAILPSDLMLQRL